MNAIRKLLVGAVLVFGMTASAQDATVEAAPEAPEVHIPVSLGILPGIGMNGLASSNVMNNFSFGLLATHAGRVEGFALSPAVNLVNRRMRGVELAGAFNLSGDLVGAQVAGAVNVARGAVVGSQVSGALNVAREAVEGVQVTGALNVAGDMRGLQLSGATNIASRFAGAQVSVINIGGDVQGAQIGVINIAGKVTGLQLGLINVSSEMYGAPIGLISAVGNGQFHVQAWASDVAPVQLSLKYGSKYVYTLVTVGFEAQRDPSEQRWLAGLGLGGHVPLGRFYVDVDGTAFNAKRNFVGPSEDALLSQLRVVGGFEMARHFSLFAGVTGNVLVDWNERDWGDVGLGPTYEVGSGKSRVALWPGLVAGVQL